MSQVIYNLKLSVPHAAAYIIDEIGIKPTSPTPNQMGRLFANLVVARSNMVPCNDDNWEALIYHFCFPDDNPAPDCFLLPLKDIPSFQACINVVEEIYQSGESV